MLGEVPGRMTGRMAGRLGMGWWAEGGASLELSGGPGGPGGVDGARVRGWFAGQVGRLVGWYEPFGVNGHTAGCREKFR